MYLIYDFFLLFHQEEDLSNTMDNTRRKLALESKIDKLLKTLTGEKKARRGNRSLLVKPSILITSVEDGSIVIPYSMSVTPIFVELYYIYNKKLSFSQFQSVSLNLSSEKLQLLIY